MTTQITAAQVKQLRDATGAGMMDTKRALQEAEGDFDEAVKILRERGMAQAAKRADRLTSEGKVGVMVRDNVGAIAAVGCETEPVSNNEDFLGYAENVLKTVFEGGDPSSIEDQRVEASAKLLAKSASQYIFISSISAYDGSPAQGGDEDTKLATLADPTVETMGKDFENYGGLKALCERAAEAAFPGRTAIVRPGYIVGEYRARSRDASPPCPEAEKSR